MKSTVIASLFAGTIVTLAALPLPAQAQGASVAKNTCDKPEDYPGRLASDTRRRTWQKSMDDYGACIKKYVDEQSAVSTAAAKAGNDAAAEYNAFVNKVKEQLEKAKQ